MKVIIDTNLWYARGRGDIPSDKQLTLNFEDTGNSITIVKY